MILFLIPLAYLVGQLFRDRVHVTHREAFTLGFLWYGAMPLVVANANLDKAPILLRTWQKIASMPGATTNYNLTIWAMAIWIAFMAGCLFAKLFARSPNGITKDHINLNHQYWKMITILFSILFILFGIVWGLSNRSILFKGYLIDYDDAVRGPLQAAILFNTFFLILSFFVSGSMSKIAKYLSIFSMSLLSILSLSIGTRQAIALSVVAILCFLAIRLNGLSKRLIISISATFIFLFTFIAAWRMHSDAAFAILTPALEPMFTYLSLSTFISFNNIPMFSFPEPLIGSFANLIPRFLWEGKALYLHSLEDSFHIFAPLGAIHMFVSLLENFGWLGSLFFIFLIGLGAEITYIKMRNCLVIISYCLVVAILSTDIWRNPFSISIVKNFTQTAIMLPVFIYVLWRFSEHFGQKKIDTKKIDPSAEH